MKDFTVQDWGYQGLRTVDNIHQDLQTTTISAQSLHKATMDAYALDEWGIANLRTNIESEAHASGPARVRPGTEPVGSLTPIGSPLWMLFIAAAYAAIVAVRKHRVTRMNKNIQY